MSWEVRTMPSVTSSCKGWFNSTLFWKNMTRFWPIWAFYGAIQFFLLPIELFNMTPGAERLTSLVPNVFHTATWMGVPLTLVFGCLIAMALFSYLMNPRAVSMYHTLPIRREGLFITNYVSAFCFYLLPSVVVGLLALLAEVRLGVFCAGGVLHWLMVQMFVGMFFFSFAVCCAMFTGHILALPVFYGVLNALVLGVSTMTDISMTSLLIGYSTRSALSSSVAVRWLTPAYHLGQMLLGGGKDGVLSFDNYVGAICYSLVGFTLFTCIALLTYQHRQLERAGDVVSVGWARPLFQWGVAVCAGLAGGVVLYQNFFPRSSGPWLFVALATASALVGAFTARALLKKSLRVLAEGWKGILAPALVMLVLMGGAHADLFGYQKWVPKAENVAAVQVYGINSAPYDDGQYFSQHLTDPAHIRAVVDIHTALVEEMDELWAAQKDPSPQIWEEDESGSEVQLKNTTALCLYYTLADGSTVGRVYDYVPVTAQDLTREDSYAARLQALLNRPELVEAEYVPQPGEGDGVRFRQMEATGASFTRGTASEDNILPYEEANRLWEAVLEDIQAGRFHRYLLADEERMENCYYTDLQFFLSWQCLYPGQSGWDSQSTVVTITPQKSATALMKALEELGLTDRLQARRESPETEEALPASQAVPADADPDSSLHFYPDDTSVTVITTEH